MQRVLIAAAKVALAATVMLANAAPAAAEWPNDRPIRVLVGFGPGGGTDILARIIAPPLSELIGSRWWSRTSRAPATSWRPSRSPKAAKDGSIAYMMNNAHGVAAAIYKSLPFDPVRDYEMVSLVGSAGLAVLTYPDFPANDVRSLIAAAKEAPGKYNYASVAVGSTQHFSGEMFRQLAGIDIRHIPYRGTPASIAAARSKEVQLLFELIQPVLGQVRSGDLKALAVTSPQRFPGLPNVPTVAESGLPGYEVTSWYGIAFPAGTPRPIVDKTYAAIKDVLERPAVREQLAKAGAVVHLEAPAHFGKHLADEVAKWKAVRDKAGLEPQ